MDEGDRLQRRELKKGVINICKKMVKRAEERTRERGELRRRKGRGYACQTNEEGGGQKQ